MAAMVTQTLPVFSSVVVMVLVVVDGGVGYVSASIQSDS